MYNFYFWSGGEVFKLDTVHNNAEIRRNFYAQCKILLEGSLFHFHSLTEHLSSNLNSLSSSYSYVIETYQKRIKHLIDSIFNGKFAVIILGDASVGKTHLVMSFAKKKLPDKPSATIGIEFETIVVNTKSGKQKSFCIWDTAGQERFRSITKSHFRRALGCFLVYDITERQSYMNIHRWLSDLRQSAPAEIVIILIGNKIDLVDGENLRKVTYEEAQQYANENGLLFFETSAISKQNLMCSLASTHSLGGVNNRVLDF
uniref:GTP-binding protein ypt3-like n=1 Tax=Dermatophagoides pteronyssinus TaxID=6956 RepID=A0A6P6XKC2_DERPT|nr:GTP-binding protein ypt3-like [Dermatophagoides pteronyssinus]